MPSDFDLTAAHATSQEDREHSAGLVDRRVFLQSASTGFALAAVGTSLGGTLGLPPRGALAAEDNFAAKKPLSVCLVSGSLEYKSDESLAALEPWLAKQFGIQCTRAFRRTDEDLPGLENLDKCDVMLLFTRRLKIDGEQLARIKEYCDAGRPIVGVRTASHAFQNWLELDREVFGGNYKGHYSEGPETEIRLADDVAGDPILAGFTPFRSVGSLYRNTGLAPDCRVLLTGAIPEHTEPIAWTREHKGGRVFYTSLGHPKDFEIEAFRHLLGNALLWTARLHK
jgi:type 1 glutamine amidotransferase